MDLRRPVHAWLSYSRSILPIFLTARMTSQQSFPILSASIHPSQIEVAPQARLRHRRVGVFMVGMAAAIALQCAVWGANPVSYNTALQDAQKQQRPLLVLVGASWCPGC